MYPRLTINRYYVAEYFGRAHVVVVVVARAGRFRVVAIRPRREVSSRLVKKKKNKTVRKFDSNDRSSHVALYARTFRLAARETSDVRML